MKLYMQWNSFFKKLLDHRGKLDQMTEEMIAISLSSTGNYSTLFYKKICAHLCSLQFYVCTCFSIYYLSISYIAIFLIEKAILHLFHCLTFSCILF